MEALLSKLALPGAGTRYGRVLFCIVSVGWAAGCGDEINCFEFPSAPREAYLACSKSSECTLIDIPDMWAAEGYPIDDASYCRFPIAEKDLDRYEQDLVEFIAVCGGRRSPAGTLQADCVTGWEDVYPVCRNSQCSRGIRGRPSAPTY